MSQALCVVLGDPRKKSICLGLVRGKNMTSSTNNDSRLETVAEVAAINNFDEVVHETEVADIFDEIEHTKPSTTLRLKLCA